MVRLFNCFQLAVMMVLAFCDDFKRRVIRQANGACRQCQAGEFCDPNTGACESCAYSCDPARIYVEVECRSFCPDLFKLFGESKGHDSSRVITTTGFTGLQSGDIANNHHTDGQESRPDSLNVLKITLCVSASVIGLMIGVCALFTFRYMKKKRLRAPLPERFVCQPSDENTYSTYYDTRTPLMLTNPNSNLLSGDHVMKANEIVFNRNAARVTRVTSARDTTNQNGLHTPESVASDSGETRVNHMNDTAIRGPVPIADDSSDESSAQISENSWHSSDNMGRDSCQNDCIVSRSMNQEQTTVEDIVDGPVRAARQRHDNDTTAVRGESCVWTSLSVLRLRNRDAGSSTQEPIHPDNGESPLDSNGPLNLTDNDYYPSGTPVSTDVTENPRNMRNTFAELDKWSCIVGHEWHDDKVKVIASSDVSIDDVVQRIIVAGVPRAKFDVVHFNVDEFLSY